MAGKRNSPTFMSDDVLVRARTLFPHTALGKMYMNHAATAVMSSRVVEAMMKHLVDRSMGRLDTYMSVDLPRIAKLRESLARLINAQSPDRIALMSNTSEGINIVAGGMNWSSGDRILLHEEEFPANVYPFLNLKRHGVEIDRLGDGMTGLSPERITDAITPRTRLVALSAVQFLTGFRVDVAAIGEVCRSRGVILAVDGIQAVGAIRIDVQEMKIDAFAAGGQKWLLSPQGTGFLYITDELQEQLNVQNLGWLSVHDPWDFYNYDQPLATSARRFEGGTRNIPGLWGMDAALSTLHDFGVDAIESDILGLTDMLIRGLQEIQDVEVITPREWTNRAGIVTIRLPSDVDGKTVFKFLRERELTISLREGMLRFSPHFYNSPTEIALAVGLTREGIDKARQNAA